jgi:hypothetical protein
MGKLATTVDERGNWPYSGVFLQESERWLYSPFPWIERWLFSQFPGVGGGGGWLWTENDSYNTDTKVCFHSKWQQIATLLNLKWAEI